MLPRANVHAAWKLAPGAVFDASDPKLFLKEDLPKVLGRARLQPKSVSFTPHVNSQAHAVEIHIRIQWVFPSLRSRGERPSGEFLLLSEVSQEGISSTFFVIRGEPAST